MALRVIEILALAAGLGLLLTASGCSEPGTGTAANNVESVKLDGEWFHLELALDPATRLRGLSGREFIEPDGGMLFVFRTPTVQRFVMRDCPIPIDIIFLDASGRITAMHNMVPDEPRREDEPETGNPATDKYEQRLVRYSSKFDAQFVIELAGNTLDRLDLEEGDQIDLDLVGLKTRAR